MPTKGRHLKINKSQLYKDFVAAYKSLHPNTPPGERQKEYNKIWNEHKSDVDHVQSLIDDWNAKGDEPSQREKENQHSEQEKADEHSEQEKADEHSEQDRAHENSEHDEEQSNAEEALSDYIEEEDTRETKSGVRSTPAQDKIIKTINDIKTELTRLECLRDSGHTSYQEIKTIENLKKDLKKNETTLERLKREVESKKRLRSELKRKVEILRTQHPEAAKLLRVSIHEETESPPPETCEPTELLQTLVDVATCDDRRRIELQRRCKTLANLGESSEQDQNAKRVRGPAKKKQIESDKEITEELSNLEETQSESGSPGIARPTPAQDRVMKKMQAIKTQLTRLVCLHNSGHASKEELRRIDALRKELRKKKNALQRLKDQVAMKKRLRSELKKKVETLRNEHPDAAEVLRSHFREKPGRPPAIREQPQLLETIVDIAAHNSTTGDRRTTLDNLTKQLKQLGFNISRSGVYLHLQPKKTDSTEGKRHTVTVPVKLSRTGSPGSSTSKYPPRGSGTTRKVHIHDAPFVQATLRGLKDLAELLGSPTVIYLSQDERARVHLSLPALTNLAPILMHLNYHGIPLPDDNRKNATRQPLTTSVYAFCTSENDSGLTRAGPTAIFVRSGKHDSSAARVADFRAVLEQDKFYDLVFTTDNEIKPVLIVGVDGRPDENPRYPKTMATFTSYFMEYDFDAVFVCTNTPGHAELDVVERRMALLSQDLAGLVLPRVHYGNHLDDQGETQDNELESWNLEKAGHLLADTWSTTVIDEYPVVAQYVQRSQQTSNLPQPSEQWKAEHIRQSKYCLQIVKCDNPSCCRPWRTNLKQILRNHFLPAPVPYKRTKTGVMPLVPGENLSNGDFMTLLHRLAFQDLPVQTDVSPIPFDLYCPSVTQDVRETVCSFCSVYFPSKTALLNHKKIHEGTSSGMTQQYVANESYIGMEDVVVQQGYEITVDAQDPNVIIINNANDLQPQFQSM